MDNQVAKDQGSTAVDSSPGLFARIGIFSRQVIAELRKVIWPTRKELVTYTWVVIAFVTFMAIYVAILDLIFGKAVLAVFGGGGG